MYVEVAHEDAVEKEEEPIFEKSTRLKPFWTCSLMFAAHSEGSIAELKSEVTLLMIFANMIGVQRVKTKGVG